MTKRQRELVDEYENEVSNVRNQFTSLRRILNVSNFSFYNPVRQAEDYFYEIDTLTCQIIGNRIIKTINLSQPISLSTLKLDFNIGTPYQNSSNSFQTIDTTMPNSMYIDPAVDDRRRGNAIIMHPERLIERMSLRYNGGQIAVYPPVAADFDQGLFLT